MEEIKKDARDKIEDPPEGKSISSDESSSKYYSRDDRSSMSDPSFARSALK